MARKYSQNSEAVARNLQRRGERDHEGKSADAVGIPGLCSRESQRHDNKIRQMNRMGDSLRAIRDFGAEVDIVA